MKTDTHKWIILNVPTHMKEQVRDAAKREGQTISALIRMLINDHLRKHPAPARDESND